MITKFEAKLVHHAPRESESNKYAPSSTGPF